VRDVHVERERLRGLAVGGRQALGILLLAERLGPHGRGRIAGVARARPVVAQEQVGGDVHAEALTVSTSRRTLSGSVSGTMPCPRFITWPAGPASRSSACTAWTRSRSGANKAQGSRLPCRPLSRGSWRRASPIGMRQSTEKQSAPVATAAGRCWRA